MENTFPPKEGTNVYSDSFTFKDDCFTVERKDKTALNIEVDENKTNAERKIVIHFQAGNYFDQITITQEAG